MAPAFLILAFTALASSGMVAVSRRTMHSAVWLIVSFLATAGIFIVLGAEFLAAVQIIIYAGSVIVLFVFVAATLGFGETSGRRRGKAWWVSLAALTALVGGEMAAALVTMIPKGPGAPAGPETAGGLRQMGALIFTGWLVPLEVLSLIILAVMIGIGALHREGRGKG
jgi:NADH-quinone oxidoreductase subunit J